VGRIFYRVKNEADCQLQKRSAMWLNEVAGNYGICKTCDEFAISKRKFRDWSAIEAPISISKACDSSASRVTI
jgi:hypothetical protein